jgi:hypothetical protein
LRLQHFSPDGYANDEKNQAHHQEKEKQKFRDSRSGCSDPAKSEQSRYQRDYQENHSPT